MSDRSRVETLAGHGLVEITEGPARRTIVAMGGGPYLYYALDSDGRIAHLGDAIRGHAVYKWNDILDAMDFIGIRAYSPKWQNQESEASSDASVL